MGAAISGLVLWPGTAWVPRKLKMHLLRSLTKPGIPTLHPRTTEGIQGSPACVNPLFNGRPQAHARIVSRPHCKSRHKLAAHKHFILHCSVSLLGSQL